MKVIRASLHALDWMFYVGPWAARLTLDRSGTFAWSEGDGPITRWLRRFWSGWHRWENDEP